MWDHVNIVHTAQASLESRPGMTHSPEEPTVKIHDHTHTGKNTHGCIYTDEDQQEI